MSKINCCHGCAPPKRRPGCHSACLEYIVERAELDKQNAIDRKKRNEKNALYEQRRQKVERAMRNRRTGK